MYVEQSSSKEHHWWPVGLQQYWEDDAGDIKWLQPDGSLNSKRRKNRKVAKKRFGHTMLRGSVWETNFENSFDAPDNEVHRLIKRIRNTTGAGQTLRECAVLFWRFVRKDFDLSDLSKTHDFDEEFHRSLLLFIFSLILRSPRARSIRENYAKIAGPERQPSEELGKANVSADFRVAERLCSSTPIGSQTFIFLHTQRKKFLVGDGYSETISRGLQLGRIDGFAFVPLSPNLCVYFCTPSAKNGTDRLIGLTALPWIVDAINLRTQIYSKDHLFFHGTKPELEEAFERDEFCHLNTERDELTEALDKLAGWHRRR